MRLLETDRSKFFLGIALLILPIFFNHNFNGGWISIGTYILLVATGILMTLYFLSKKLKINCLYIFILVLLVDCGIYAVFYFVKTDQLKSPSAIQFSQDIYFDYLRNVPAFQVGLGQYDSDLFYTLKPNNSNPIVNSNIEFSNSYTINSQGVRDDEASLDFPKIIMLGDSHTMGWGVDQEESFSNLVEQKTKMKVLNTGIVSYGSARQYLMFQKLKTDSCQTIIWQYCSNDLRENQSFLENGNQLSISSEQEYQFQYKRNFLHSNYYPFKYVFETFAHQIRKRIKRKPQPYQNLELTQQVNNLFSILKLLQEDFHGNIILFNLESFDTTDEYFLAFKEYIEDNHLEKIQLIDFSKILNEDDYFIIDGHINVSGHRKVSDAIWEAIFSKNKL